LEILNRYGLKGTFNVNSGLDSSHGTWVYKDMPVHRLNLPEAVEIYRGHEIAVHGYTHLNLADIPEDIMKSEIETDIREIQKVFGVRPVGMAYPYGAYNLSVTEAASQAGLCYGRGAQSIYGFAVQENLMCFQPTCHHDDEKLFLLADEFLKAEEPNTQIFYIWGHSYEFEGNKNWDRFERFCERVSGKKDIFYGTNEEIFRAVAKVVTAKQ
jgi:hypothetical protein